MKIAMLGLKGIPYPEGIENFTEEIGWRLAKRGNKVMVYSRGYVDVGEEHRGIRIVKLPSFRSKHLETLSHTFLSALDVLRRDVDIVQFNALGPCTFAWIPKLKGIKTVGYIHGLDWKGAKWGWLSRQFLRLGELASVLLPDRTIVVSRILKEYFEKKYHKRVSYIPNGVNFYPPRSPNKIKKLGLEKDNYLLFLGRLVPEKGCHYLIQAFNQIKNKMKLVVAGGESHSDKYVRSLKKIAGKRIVFVGYVKEELLEELFSNCYLYIHPSDLEGLSISLLQAMSFGCCIVCSDIPENTAVVSDYAYTFRRGDSENLREILEELINHPAKVRSRRGLAIDYVRSEFNWDSIVDQLEEVYGGMLSEE